MTTIPRRLVVCVDGTWFHPDGGASKKGNVTNVYRLFASVKRGECISEDGKRYFQEPVYVHGIGSEESISNFEKYCDGAFGLKCFDQIKKIYRKCCCLKNPGDEVWLYGFSRGAYVVRAVAGLLHYIQALTSADLECDELFDSDYEAAKNIYEKMQRISEHNQGNIHHMLTAKTREAPIIKFIGAFDTVKAVEDKSLYDIDFNDSIQHMRAALSLNENRKAMQPEGIWPSWGSKPSSLNSRSFVQAWFVGAHTDIGGSAEQDGLALYPLQWMILESQAKGLHFKFTGSYGGRAPLQNPLELIGLDGSNSHTWSCTTENNMTVEMRDIRYVHGNSLFGKGYEIKLNRARGMLAQIVKHRKPFESNGKLRGYCSFGPQGTIIHPSVYMVMDQELNKAMDKKAFPFRSHLEEWREKMLGVQGNTPNLGFWNDHQEAFPDEPFPIRVLVCGITGVGKSTLVNEVFGVETTTCSDYKSGQHDVNREIKYDGRPDLIVHDSRGFEAAGVEEFNLLEEFLRERSKKVEVSDRLHVIWLCATALDCRLIGTSNLKIFEAIKQYAGDIPVIVIATKMDDLLGSAQYAATNKFRKEGVPYTHDDLEKEGEKKLDKKLIFMRKQLAEIGAHVNACIATSKDDPESIDRLNVVTKDNFSCEKARFSYVRLQQRDIDAKIENAMDRIMKVYKQLLGSSASTAGIPGAPTSIRTGAAIKICRTILNCFYLPTVSAEAALEIYRTNVWDDLANNVRVFAAETMSALAVVATVLSGGLPVFLGPMAWNIPSVVQATMRLTMVLACDMIIIMSMACRKALEKCLIQPETRDVEFAARAYRQRYKVVHSSVKKLIPNFVQAFKVGTVDLGFREIINDHKNMGPWDSARSSVVSFEVVNDVTNDVAALREYNERQN